jgi:hypothetical protein
MVQYSAVGVYRTLGEAEAAVRSLGGGGFPIALLVCYPKTEPGGMRVPAPPRGRKETRR